MHFRVCTEEDAFSVSETSPTFRCGRSQHSDLDESDPRRTVVSVPTNGASVLPAGALCCALGPWAPALDGVTAATKQRFCHAGAECSRAGASQWFSLCLKPRPKLCCLTAKAELTLSHLKTVTVRIYDLAEKTAKVMKREGFVPQKATEIGHSKRM